MPSNQTAKSSSRAGGSAERKQPQSQPAARAQPRSRGQTGERDENYALISVLYHALQGAETIDQYIEDAREAGDDELALFFEETKEAYVERAAEAKELLAARLESEDEDESDEDDVSDEEEDEDED